MINCKTWLAGLGCCWTLATLPGWTVPLIDPSFDDVANFNTNWNPQLGSPAFNFVSVGSPGNNAGAVDGAQNSVQLTIFSGLSSSTSLGISQAVSLTAFHSYQLQFWLLNLVPNAAGTFSVLAGNASSFVRSDISLAGPAPGGFVLNTVNFSTAADPNANLLLGLFSTNPSQDLLVLLDDVSLTDLGPLSAPEVNGRAALLPLAFVSIGLALIQGRRRRAIQAGS